MRSISHTYKLSILLYIVATIILLYIDSKYGNIFLYRSIIIIPIVLFFQIKIHKMYSFTANIKLCSAFAFQIIFLYFWIKMDFNYLYFDNYFSIKSIMLKICIAVTFSTIQFFIPLILGVQKNVETKNAPRS